MTAPTPYQVTIRHSRTERIRRSFRYRQTMWLVDLDQLPATPKRFRALHPQFAADDHVGDPSATIRANVERELATHGITAVGRIVMLTNPRLLGYAFNPLSVFWCYDHGDDLQGIVAEVHNTYGQRHCYVVRPDPQGRDRTNKEFYVSPFFEVDGTYDMRFGEPLDVTPDGAQPVDELRVSITLRRGPENEPAFSASLVGVRRPAPRWAALSTLRRPWSSRRVMLLIRWQGLRIWAHRVPVIPRPSAGAPESPALVREVVP